MSDASDGRVNRPVRPALQGRDPQVRLVQEAFRDRASWVGRDELVRDKLVVPALVRMNGWADRGAAAEGARLVPASVLLAAVGGGLPDPGAAAQRDGRPVGLPSWAVAAGGAARWARVTSASWARSAPKADDAPRQCRESDALWQGGGSGGSAVKAVAHLA